MCDKKVRVVGVLCPKTRLDRRYDNFITNQRLNLYGGPVNIPRPFHCVTSIVFPLIAVMTSPGLLAHPDGIFSHKGTRAVTLIGTFSLAMASNAALTVAAPPISAFMSPIPAAGLILIPPLTKEMKKKIKTKVQPTQT